ncbi:UvrB/UvrC motif-containing protein, partial [bacterium]|nr:UvrB/UvrC motif-containing protein [bacterium]
YLNQKLKEAVEIEAYEEAAQIRDKIRDLEKKKMDQSSSVDDEEENDDKDA